MTLDRRLNQPPPFEPPAPAEPRAETVLSSEEAYALTIAENEKWDAFVRRYFERLCGYVRAHEKTEEEAEDLVQNALIKARANDAIAQCDGDEKRIYGYVLKSLKNGARNDRRRIGRVRERLDHYLALLPISGPAQPDEYALALDINRHLNRAIYELPERCREAFILTRILGSSYEEAAEVMDIQETTIDAHLKRALRLLAKALMTVGYDPGVDDRRARKEVTP